MKYFVAYILVVKSENCFAGSWRKHKKEVNKGSKENHNLWEWESGEPGGLRISEV